MKTEFVIADEYGRELFKSYCTQQKQWCKVIKESKDEHSPWDISYFSGSTIIIGEIKVRNYKSNAFSDWDYEEKKHIGLKEVYKKMVKKYPNKKIEIQYINIFEDQAVRIWTTTNIETLQKPETKLRPSTTVGQTFQKTKSIYNCNLDHESNRGLLYDIFENTRFNDEDEDDGLPF
jgi:hypothetical protein